MKEKDFNKEIGVKFKRSELKRWKKAFYLKERNETPLEYFKRMIGYITK
jgi:hypothetical protein